MTLKTKHRVLNWVLIMMLWLYKQIWFQNRRMKDKRQRVALAWPYGLTADPAFYAYLVNAAAAAASLSQYSYPPHHAANQHSSPPFNYAAASSAIQRGYSYPHATSHLAAQFPFPVGLVAAAAVVARSPAGRPSSQPTSSSATTLQPEVAPLPVTSPEFFPGFLSYRSNSLPPLTRTTMSSPVAGSQRTTSTLFQPYKTDDSHDDDKQLWRHHIRRPRPSTATRTWSPRPTCVIIL